MYHWVCTSTWLGLTHLYAVIRNVVIHRSGCRRRQASGLWSVVAPAVRQQRPPKWPRDPHALRRPAPGLRPLASAAFGHGDRLGILRVQGALVIHVVLHNNNTGGTGTAVLQCTLQYFCSTGGLTLQWQNYESWSRIFYQNRLLYSWALEY